MKCCFTGHRPQTIYYLKNKADIRYYILYKKLQKEIKNLIKQGYNYFISGMALGIDIMCANIVLKLKKKNPKIILECALPNDIQSKYWNKRDQNKYNKILNRADKINYISKTCSKYSFILRNKYMVNVSDVIIAVWNGIKKGGTFYTVNYAIKQNIKIIIIDPSKLI